MLNAVSNFSKTVFLFLFVQPNKTLFQKDILMYFIMCVIFWPFYATFLYSSFHACHFSFFFIFLKLLSMHAFFNIFFPCYSFSYHSCILVYSVQLTQGEKCNRRSMVLFIFILQRLLLFLFLSSFAFVQNANSCPFLKTKYVVNK